MFEGDLAAAWDLAKWLIVAAFTLGIAVSVLASAFKLGLKLWWVVFIGAAYLWFFG